MSKIKHIALFKFHDQVNLEKIEEIFEQILDLTEVVPGIEDYVSGPSNTPDGLGQGFSYGFIMTFSNMAARDGYNDHPECKHVESLVLPHVKEVCIFDFEI